MSNLRTIYGRRALRSWLRLRNHHFSSPVPLAQYTFSGAEIWLILRLLGVVASDISVPAELVRDQDMIEEAQAHLLACGLLTQSVTDEYNLSAAVEAIVRPTTAPDSVVISTITDTIKSGKLERTICCSFTKQATVINWVDDQGLHHFKAFSAADRPTCLFSHLREICNWNFEETEAEPTLPTTAEFEAEMQQMQQMVLLMAITGVTQPEQTSDALSWFVGERYAWLMENRERTDETIQKVTERSQIELAVLEIVEKMLPRME